MPPNWEASSSFRMKPRASSSRSIQTPSFVKKGRRLSGMTPHDLYGPLRYRDRGVHHRPRMHASRALPEQGRDLVRRNLAPTGRGQDQHAADSEALRFHRKLSNGPGSEDHPDRKSLIDERLHPASPGAEPVSDLGHKPALKPSGVEFILRRLTLALAARDGRGAVR